MVIGDRATGVGLLLADGLLPAAPVGFLATAEVLAVAWVAEAAFRALGEVVVTPVSFAEELLRSLGLPRTENNVRALVAFQSQEGGHENGAFFNPLNTMRGTPTGDKDLPSVNFKTGKPGPGIQAFASWDDGLEATARTMRQGNMRPIFDSLRASAPAAQTVKVIGDSDWGWWDPKKGKAFKLPHLAADAIVRSQAEFVRYGQKAYSGAGALLGSRALKYGAIAVLGVLAIGGLAYAGVSLSKKMKERRRAAWVQSS